ncbi:MAG: AAC(3) family N-acetyltransferase [Bacteroidia bacterium]
MHTLHSLRRDIERLGIVPGDVLLVHSSLRAVGPVVGGAATVVVALLEALGPAGTLLMPALSYMTVTEVQPVFDLRRTPVCVGFLPMFFWQYPGVRRSLHPTHSVCATGRLAGDLLARHETDDTPVGPQSPFSKLPGVGGKLAFIGCTTRPNTSMHGVEEQVAPPYLFRGAADYILIDADGRRLQMHMRQHNFAGWAQRYERIEGLLHPGEWQSGRVGDAQTQVLDGRAVWIRGLDALRADPLYFVQATT